MVTVIEFLDALGFDWESGRIIVHKTEDNKSPGWSTACGAKIYTSKDAAILREQFDNGYGGPECPRFIAEDKDAIYFPAMYDGSTWPEKIWKNIDRYLDYAINETPYPGGN